MKIVLKKGNRFRNFEKFLEFIVIFSSVLNQIKYISGYSILSRVQIRQFLECNHYARVDDPAVSTQKHSP